MKFNDAMSAIRESASSTVNIPEAWGQGRATFGGMVAAAMFERIIPQVAQDRPVRSIMVSFVAPVAPGDLEVMVKVLREGKAATQVQATAYQNDQACAVLLASFGAGRDSAVTVAPGKAPAFKSPDDVQAFPYIPGLTPEFTHHFDYRYTVGTMPFMGSDKTEMGGWIKLREGSGNAVTVPEILALLDAWPPASLSMMTKPVAGSSLTWTISFAKTPEDCSASDWWQYLARIQSSAHGYSQIESTLWDKNGNVAVFSQQTVSVFG